MRLGIRRHTERGDTIIEVLFAVAVFSLVAVGCLAIMNQGTATAQRSLEVTLVRQQIQAQAEALRYINTAYISGYQENGTPPAGPAAEWAKIRSSYAATGGATKFGDVTGTSCPASVPGTNPFIMNARTAKIQDKSLLAMSPGGDGSLPPFAQVMYDDSNSVTKAYGLWIEAVPSDGADVGYVDFHIRACWESPGASRPMTLGTIVRLYDPTI